MDERSLNPSVEKFLNLIKKSRQGNLKIYLGLSAGVGKTYRMLQEAHELQKNGVDILIGYIETHGRKETEDLIAGIPVIPRKNIFYKGKEFEEFNIDAVLMRRPEVVIIDELAHTNIPGSRNEKRYQDVEELIYNGINVISAVNIQHIESLNSVVEEITGIEVKERIPDSVIGLADEVVNIDITTDELIKRLHQGKIYKADKIESALINFFTKDNLLQLRELALREVANAVEKKIYNEVPQDEQARGDNILVCLGNDYNKNEKIIRRTARIAERFDSRWYVIYVESPGNSFEKLELQLQRHLINNFKLASELGGLSEKISSEDVIEGILKYAKEKMVSKIILGKPAIRNYFSKIVHRNIIDRLLDKVEKENNEYDIEILS